MTVREWAQQAWGEQPPPLTNDQQRGVVAFGYVDPATTEQWEAA